jgi:hypothetical protein
MSMQQANEIRALTGAELDAVSGGVFDTWDRKDFIIFGAAIGAVITGGLSALWDWLTD